MEDREQLASYFPCLCVDALAAYEWLFCYLWVESKRKLDSELATGKVIFVQVATS